MSPDSGAPAELAEAFVEALTADHERAGFRCGVAELDQYFRRQAGRDAAKHLAAVFVLALEDGTVAGYYTLSSATLFLPDLLGASRRRTSRYPQIPAAKLSRLAVDKRFRKRGYGRLLLADALCRVRSSSFSSVALIAEAGGETAREFYKREGFLIFPDRPDMFFRPMADIAALFAA